jgi:serine/threonine-protein kinase
MMSRSGGFNVPADYFKRGKTMPEPVPATPDGYRPRPSWPLYAGVAGVLTAIGIVVAIFAKTREGAATPPPPATIAAAPVETKPTEPEPEVAPVEEPMLVTQQVVLAVDPLDAHAFLGNRDLGPSPVVVEVAEGQSVDIEIRRQGYVSQTVSLDGSAPRRSIQLKRAVAASRPRPAPAAAPSKPPAPKAEKNPPRKPSFGGGEIVDPWGQ